MKKIILVFMSILMVLAITSCSGKGDDKDVTTGEKTDGSTTVYTTTTNVETTTSEVTTTEKISYGSSSAGAPWIISKPASSVD